MKAIALKKARLSAQPYPDPKSGKEDFLTGEKIKKVKETKLVDTNAGFFIEEVDDDELASASQPSEPRPAPVVEPDRPKCLECKDELADSYLFRTFDFEVCDKCKETEKDGKHELITKTDAKNEFLLKDFDFDVSKLHRAYQWHLAFVFRFQREPALKFILRKNPHNPRWGDMKLFLRFQVEKRALEVWGTEEALENEHEKREEKRDQAKVKKFNKKLKALRMQVIELPLKKRQSLRLDKVFFQFQVRGSLYKKDISAHEHDYGEEVYDEDEDQYSRTCKTCNHVHSYEKM